VNVTLADVFNGLNAAPDNGGYEFNATDWFNSGTYKDTDLGSTLQLGLPLLNKLETYFSGVAGSSSKPILQVDSPVNVIITDSATGQKYVSDPGLARPGDIVLSKSLYDVADLSDEDGDPGELTPEPYPPYNLNLPTKTLQPGDTSPPVNDLKRSLWVNQFWSGTIRRNATAKTLAASIGILRRRRNRR
jgi:hypothetical protein